MSSPSSATAAIYRWADGALHPLDYCDMTDTVVEVADSWFVGAGRAFALGLHRGRFLGSISPERHAQLDVEAFWDAVIAAIPREGDWFPRVELQSRGGAPLLVFRLRSAPERTRSVVVASNPGADPRTAPTVKGPDLESMLRIRTAVQARGAEEAIVLSDDGYVVEGAYSGLLWWRGEILCGPADELERVDSVTAKSVLALAAALGTEVFHEAVTPAELDGVELWALSALHGIRIVTEWVDGPSLAERPGRLGLWRDKLAALARPI
jgi:branched-subunit amino acid aminotransferase/4-amino-4-deoxychorismate lyase